MNGAGRGTLPPDHACAFAQSRGWALGNADLVIVLGAPLDFRLGYGRPPSFAEDARVVMVDCDPTELGRNRALELGLHAHIGKDPRSDRRDLARWTIGALRGVAPTRRSEGTRTAVASSTPRRRRTPFRSRTIAGRGTSHP
jgi:acetolactate synthase-1/2/3 large subunit